MAADSKSDPKQSELTELLNLTFPADLDLLLGVTDKISAALERLDVPEQKRLEIGLAVQEALVNAVVHGCENDRSKQVGCRMESDAAGHIVITISDPGPGFNPDAIPDPKSNDRMYHDHGRGVFLIRELMDEVQFEHGGRAIRMWKY